MGPVELTLYRVRAKLLISLAHENDSDIHLLLTDPDHPEAQMIAEIPAPECAVGSGHEAEFRRARAVVRSLRLNSLVEIDGVGFFDTIADRPYGAKNGIELHPVLGVRLIEARPKVTAGNRR
jgi:hypothetical protein